MKGDEYDRLIERFDGLREADREAVRLAHADLSARLEGFPQQFATKDEMQAAAAALQRLEKDAVSREIYLANLDQLRTLMQKLEWETLPKATFDTFIDNYRIEQERAAVERRNVADVLANATDKVRAQLLEERGDFISHDYYETAHAALVRQINAAQAWQYKIIGGLVFATFIAPLVTGVVVYVVTH